MVLDPVSIKAANEVADALLQAAELIMERYVSHPNGQVIVAAGFAVALQQIGERTDKRIPTIVGRMLTGDGI